MNPFNRNKILSHWEQIEQYKKHGETAYPTTVELSLTNKCNHKCPACSGLRDNTEANSFIKPNLIKSIIGQISNIGVKGVIFTGGGEPCMYEDYDKFIALANSSRLQVGLITNGSMIDQSHIKNLLCCKWIRISLDAASTETYKKLHGIDAFEQTLDNIKMLTECNRNTTIGIGFLTCEKTEKEIIAFAKLASELGVDYCQYRPIHGLRYKESINNQIAYAKDYYETNKFKVLYSEFKFTTLRGCETARTYSHCHAANFVTHIAADACVYMCCHCINGDTYLGDLKKNSFKEIWQGKKGTIDNYNITKCLNLCRNDCSNRDLDVIINGNCLTHGNFL